jgi:hypothetical protein
MCLRTTDDREVRSELFIGSLGVGGGQNGNSSKEGQRRASRGCGPAGFHSISRRPQGTRRSQNCGLAEIHTREPASPRLLRLLINSRGDLKLLEPLDPRIRRGLSRPHSGAEYRQEGGRDISGFTISTVLWNNEFDPKRNSRSEIHFPKEFSQIRGSCRNSGLVRRGRWQALRDDAKRPGKNQTHSQQSQGTSRPLQHSRPGHWSRISGDSTHLAARRL